LSALGYIARAVSLQNTRTLRLLIATSNPGKQRELRQLFGDLPGLELFVPADVGGLPEVVEDGDTFEHNARKKALEIAADKHMAVISDDSGLEVDALGGRPSVRSARYAGEHASDDDNNAKLIAELSAVAPEQRTARYRVVLAFVDPGAGAEPFVHVEHASCEGRMRDEARGSGGFGYDPYFEPLGYPCTMAELSAEEKNRISHRALAARALRGFLTRYLAARSDRSL
jgi:XTP/dITP diphosphohydrolase